MFIILREQLDKGKIRRLMTLEFILGFAAGICLCKSLAEIEVTEKKEAPKEEKEGE